MGADGTGMEHWLWDGGTRISIGAWGSQAIEDGTNIADEINPQVLVTTYDGNGMYKFFQDGMLKEIRYSTIFNIGANPRVTVGMPRLNDEAFQGEIYQVKIWDVNLGLEEVQQVTEYSNLNECLAFPSGECGKRHYQDTLGPDLRPMPCYRAACCSSNIQTNYVLEGSSCQCVRRCNALFAEVATFTPTAHYCSGTKRLTAPSDSFREAVGLYRENMHCNWRIEPERNPTSVTLEFTTFMLESQYDIVKVTPACLNKRTARICLTPAGI
jgi:hypothetical protein